MYLSTVESRGATDVQTMAEQSLSREKGELVMTLAEKLKNEGKQQGIIEGLLQGIELGFGIKFGARGLKLMPAVRRIQDPERLKAVMEVLKIAGDIKIIKAVIADCGQAR